MADTGLKPHRVPESVFSVEFKLFDFMTMKQFYIVLATVLLSVGFYFLLDRVTSPFIKWLVVILVAIVGLIIAFVKVQGEPFEVYVTNFLLALVSPQRRVWKKESELPRYLQESKSDKQQIAEAARSLAKEAAKKPPPVSEKMLRAQKQEATVADPVSSELDTIEQQYLQGKLPVYGAVTKSASGTAAQEQTRSQPQTQQSQGAQEELTPPELMNTGLNEKERDLMQTPAKPGIIWGVVKDDKDQMLAGANVSVSDQTGKTVASITTNPLGQFRVGGELSPGTYTVQTAHENYQYQAIQVTVGPNPLEPQVIKPIPTQHTQPNQNTTPVSSTNNRPSMDNRPNMM